MKKILFISHESSRTGAPFMLLYLLQWFREKHPEIRITTLSLYDGVLSDQFQKVSHEYYELSGITNPKQNLGQRLQKKISGKLGFKYDQPNARNNFIDDLSRKNFDIIYSNTTVSLPLAQKIKVRNGSAKLILHVHELESEIKRTITGFGPYLNDIDFMLAASGMVRDNLIENHKVNTNKVKVVYEFTKKLYPVDKEGNRNIFNVGGSGKFGHRKGTDLFIQVARYLKDHYPNLNLEFTWVGLVPDYDQMSLKIELEKLGLGNNVNFTGEVEKPEQYFKDFDVFLMTSREDPFPLVCIEAGMLGIPIICFDKTTGISEIIGDNGGFIVPYLNIEAMAEKLVLYLEKPSELEEHSQFNKRAFSKFTVEQQGEEILRVIEDTLK